MIKIFNNIGVEIPFKSFKFSGGEISVKIGDRDELADERSVLLFAMIKNSDDIMELLMVTDAIRQIKQNITIDLSMPYLPYARQDRVMVPGEAMSLKVFTSIINAQNYNQVVVWDAHSEVGVALLDRCVNLDQATVLSISVCYNIDPEKTILVSPDAGAEKKIYKFAKTYGIEDIVFASKVRDVNTGQIIQTNINGAPETRYTYKDFLIVDDICDGGRTFIELALKLRPRTTGKIKLLVTHGIFSKGIGVFDGIIDQVIVLNNINNVESTDMTEVIG